MKYPKAIPRRAWQKSMFSLFYNFVFRMYNVHVALLSDMKMAFLIVPFSLNLVQRNKNQRVGIFNSRKVYGFTDLFGGYIWVVT